MTLFMPWLAAFLLAFSVTPLIIRFANHMGLVDDPARRHHPARTHTGVIPRAGGLALYVGLIFPMLFFLPLSKLTIGILAGAGILVVMGLLDDQKDVSPYIRLCTNGIAAILLVGAGAGIPFITNPLTGGVIPLDIWRLRFTFLGTHSILPWADVFAFLWIMWTMNIVGWSAGVDGQMPGFVAICAFVLGILSLRFSVQDPTQVPVAILSFIVCGAFLGFLPWNFYPQKIMPGYGGKTLAGFLLALLGILSYGKLGTALLVLGIPTIDAAYTLLRRVTTKKSPLRADRGHLHHRLLDLGWGRRRVALFYWGVSAILGLVSLTITSKQKLFALLLVAVIVGGLLTWLHFLSRFLKQHAPDSG